MTFYFADENRLGLGELNPLCAQLLKLVPGTAGATDSQEVKDRLFPMPSNDEQLNEEWQDFTQQEIRRHFDTASQTVQDDLANLTTEDDPETNFIEFPIDHIDCWLNCLNQARLALYAQHGLGEEDMEMEFSGDITDGKELILFQIHLYGFIQEGLLRILEKVSEE